MKTNRLIVIMVGGIMLGGILVSVPVCSAAAQAQDNVVEAAKKAQAAKKNAPKPKLVIDDDNLSTVTGIVNVVGQEPASPDASKASADEKGKAEAKPKGEETAKDEKYWRKAFADANRVLTDDAHEIDILQREYNLKQQQYYSDPNTALKEQYTNKDLIDTKQKIDDKTAAVAKDKQDISDLEDQLRQAGGDPGWAR
jgi:hypothetical protein